MTQIHLIHTACTDCIMQSTPGGDSSFGSAHTQHEYIFRVSSNKAFDMTLCRFELQVQRGRHQGLSQISVDVFRNFWTRPHEFTHTNSTYVRELLNHFLGIVSRPIIARAGIACAMDKLCTRSGPSVIIFRFGLYFSLVV